MMRRIKTLTKKEYKEIRKLYRSNGRYILRQLNGVQYEFLAMYLDILDSLDNLRARRDIVSWCKREGLEYNFRQIM